MRSANIQYALRKDPVAIEHLGNDIKYQHYWPWIGGTINQIKGVIDFSYAVEGDKAKVSCPFEILAVLMLRRVASTSLAPVERIVS